MEQLKQFRKHLTRGKVYRRNELTQWSNAVDRHLAALVNDGTLQKLSPGMYYYPNQSAFGKTPPDEEALVRSFLKDDRFLLTSPNAYNSLGVGTSQLYNKVTVYNHKRHGEFRLGNRNFDFQRKPHFPKKLTEEFLVVDLVNNLDQLAEDPQPILKKIADKLPLLDQKKLKHAVDIYGNLKGKRLLQSMLHK